MRSRLGIRRLPPSENIKKNKGCLLLLDFVVDVRYCSDKNEHGLGGVRVIELSRLGRLEGVREESEEGK
ncbi:hypothetical protein AGMMS50296_0510 [Alphaproteobacteria bacterium]|nr:hypothetical protein AGMMS50296_0510 [Alphaproteobacteria bacterium]